MIKMAIKNSLFAAALLSLALASGCAKGGGGPCVSNCASVTINAGGVSQAALNVSIPMTVTTVPVSTPVNWSITPTACGSACGTLTNVTTSSATYVGPSSIPSDPSFTIVATSQSDSSVSDSLPLKIVPVTTAVAPVTLSVGNNLTQQFTAVAVPDNAPQTFTWDCKANGNPCTNFTPAANQAGQATYVAHDNCSAQCIQVSAAATVDPTGCSIGSCTVGKASVVASRLVSSANPPAFSFQFAGYDNGGKQVFVAGTFMVSNNSITSGVEDEISWNGSQYSWAQHSITGGAYTPINAADPNSNNSGTLTLALPAGVYPSQFQVVLNAAGDLQMIESDSQGSGSGIAEPLFKNNTFNSGNQAFAFGFTGVDSTGNRVGYAGLLPIDGTGVVTGGMMDVNDNGSVSNSDLICGGNTPPCNVAGSYSADPNISNLWHLNLSSPANMNFDFFLANGNGNVNTPLTLYAISRGTVDSTHPAVLGTMVLQDSKQTYNNAGLKGTSISALTGASANVSLTLGNTDGNGGFSGRFDQNNAGAMVSVSSFSSYTYAANSTPNGRYTFQMLGNPSANPVVPPVPFILYASGANRGFLLDQSSTAVITGTMTPQKSPPKSVGAFVASALPGTYAVATNSNSSSSILPLTMNLLLTSPGNSVYNVGGKQNPGNQDVAGAYTLDGFSTLGTFVLTAPAAAHYIFYPVDITDFYMIVDASKDKGVSSPILFVSQ